jgi:hypothetical protein
MRTGWPTLWLVLALMSGMPGPARGQDSEGLRAAEYQVKAAFVYKFGDYVEWPAETFADDRAPLRIGVLGADELADELARIVAQRTMSGHPVRISKLRTGEQALGQHLVFVGSDAGVHLEEVLEAGRGQAVLIVTESPQALRRGSTINFVVVDTKVRFDIALATAQERGIKISSRLLAVARKVVGKPP